MKPEIETWLAKKAILSHFFACKMTAPDLQKYSDAEIIEWAEKIWEARMKYENEHQLAAAIKTDEQKMALLNTIQLPQGYQADKYCNHCFGRGKVLVQHGNNLLAIYCKCIRKSIIAV